MEIFLKQGIEITPIDADISGNVRDKNFIGIIVPDKLDRFFHVKIAAFQCRGIGKRDFAGEDREKLVQAAFEKILVGGVIRIVLLHLEQKRLQFTGKVALVDRVLLGKTEFLYLRGSFFAVKTDPEIGPGIIRIGFIAGADIWHQEKALSGG